MADESIVGAAVIELRAENAKLKQDLEVAGAAISASMSKVEREQAKFAKSVQGKLDSINAVKATRQMDVLAAAVQKAGGVSNLSANQLARVTAEVSKLAAAGAKVPASLESLTGSTSKLSAAFQSLTSGGGVSGALAAIGPAGVAAAAGIGVIAAAGGQAFAALKDLAAEGERWTNLAKQTGLGVVEVQQLSALLEDASIPADALGTAMKELQKEIATGGAELQKFGIEVSELKNLSPEQQFRAMAEQIAAIEDPATRTAVAVAAFGRAGADLIPVLDDIAVGADKAFDALNETQIAALNEADRVLDAFGRKWDLFWKTRAASAVQAFGILTDFLRTGSFESPTIAAGPALPASAANKEQERQRKAAAAAEAKAAKERAAAQKAAAAEAKAAADEDKRRANDLAKLDKERVATLRSIVTARVDEGDELRGLDQMSRQLLDTQKQIEAEMVAAKRDTRLRQGDLLESIGGRGFFTRFQDVVDQEQANDIERINAAIDRATTVTLDWGEALQGVAFTFGSLSATGTDTFGRLANAASIAAGTIQNVRAAGGLKTKAGKSQAVAGGLAAAGSLFGDDSKVGGALSGAGQGAAIGTAILPGYGTAIGAVIGGVVGFIKKGKELKKQLAEMKAGFIDSAGGMDALKAKAKEAGVSLDAFFKAKDKKSLTKAIEDVTAGIDRFEKKMQGLADFRSGFEAAEAALADIDKSPELQNALAAIAGKLDVELGKLGIFRSSAALQESKEFGASQQAARGLAQALAGARAAGVVDTGLLGATGVAATELRKQAEAAALAAGESQQGATRAGFGAIAELLREQLNAELQSSGKVSAALQAQLAEAKANGLEILADPAIESLGVQRQQLDVLQKGFGVVADAVTTAATDAAAGAAGPTTGLFEADLQPALDRLAFSIDKFDPGALTAARFGALPEGEGIAADIVSAIDGLNRPDVSVSSAPQLTIHIDGTADARIINAAVDAMKGELRKRDAELDALVAQAAERAVQ